MWRYGKKVIHCRVLYYFWLFWSGEATDSADLSCKWFPTNLRWFLRNRLSNTKVHHSHSSEFHLNVTSLSCVTFSCSFVLQPAKVCIPWVALETSDVASNELGSTLILLSSFTEAIRHPRTFWCHLTWNGRGTWSHIRWEDTFVTTGRDLDTTLSPSFCSWILFAIVMQLIKLKLLVQRKELKWLNIEQMKKTIPLSTREIPFSQHVCDLVFGVNVFEFGFFGSKLNHVKQPIQSKQLCGSVKHVSVVGLLLLTIFLNYRLSIFKEVQHGTSTRMYCVGWNVVNVIWNDVGLLALNECCACLAWVACNGVSP